LRFKASVPVDARLFADAAVRERWRNEFGLLDLIAIKQAAGRPKDLDDAARLAVLVRNNNV
jgi:hypothetical protein